MYALTDPPVLLKLAQSGQSGGVLIMFPPMVLLL
jgi:hypothetical protein